MKLSNYLNEKWIKKTAVHFMGQVKVEDYYKNPTPEDFEELLREFPKSYGVPYARGFVTKEGDLYAWSGDVVHLSASHDLFGGPENAVDKVPVVIDRNMKGHDVERIVSVTDEYRDFDYTEKDGDRIKSFINKCMMEAQKNNSDFKFKVMA